MCRGKYKRKNKNQDHLKKMKRETSQVLKPYNGHVIVGSLFYDTETKLRYFIF